VLAAATGRLEEYQWWLVLFVHGVALAVTLAFARRARTAAARNAAGALNP